MKYKCIPCDHEFEAKSGAKPRCPRCLKIHDVEPLAEIETEKGGSGKFPVVPVAVVLIAVAVGGVYYYLQQKDDVKGDAKGGVSKEDAASLLAGLDIPEKDRVEPCEVTDGITAFAKKSVDGGSGEAAMDALFKTISGFKDQGRWRSSHQREPSKTRPLTADKLLAALSTEQKSPLKVTSYELACLMLAAARSQDLDANLVEITSFKGEKKPADPSGKLGRYGVVLGPASDASPLYDVYGGRSKGAAKANVTPLDAAGQMAPYFGISALSMLMNRDMSLALKLNDAAIALDPESPHYRASRGLIFAGTGVPEESLVEFEKAVKKRNDAVQRTNLAEILMAVNPLDKRAETEIQAAIDEMPDFARAHALKAMIHLIRQEPDVAETELALAERLDPKSPAVAMYWARFHSAKMNSDQAVAKAEEAVRLSENSVTMLLALAGIYKEVARFDDMRSTLDQVFKQVDSAAMSDQIKQMFGYDPSDAEEAPEESDDALAGGEEGLGDAPSGLKLELGKGLGKGPGSGLGLGNNSLGGGGSGLGQGLGGGGLKQDGSLKLDMKLK